MNRLAFAMLVLALFLASLSVATADMSGGKALGSKPYMGWSSWSEQEFYSANIEPKSQNPQYMDWLTSTNIKAQSRAMHQLLQKHGYTYINIDSGWSSSFDNFGRPIPDPTRFPGGIKAIADYVHKNDQKIGVYYIPGIDGRVLAKNPLIYGTNIHIQNIVFVPNQLATAWNSNAKIDYSSPGAQEYINSIADEFAHWGVDFLKLDGVTPNADNDNLVEDARPDVIAWQKALAQCGRPIWLELSWNLSPAYADFWDSHGNGRRITGDIESYSTTYTNWNAVRLRFDAASTWSGFAGPDKGWNDLDSLDLVNGVSDGLTDVERRTCVSLWAICCSPLYCGGDLTTIDPVGLSLITNDEVIGVDQSCHPATRISPGPQQIWRVHNNDGTETVGLFNLDSQSAAVTVNWSDLGIAGPAKVRDLWQHSNLGVFAAGYTSTIAPHASLLLNVTPTKKAGR